MTFRLLFAALISFFTLTTISRSEFFVGFQPLVGNISEVSTDSNTPNFYSYGTKLSGGLVVGNIGELGLYGELGAGQIKDWGITRRDVKWNELGLMIAMHSSTVNMNLYFGSDQFSFFYPTKVIDDTTILKIKEKWAGQSTGITFGSFNLFGRRSSSGLLFGLKSINLQPADDATKLLNPTVQSKQLIEFSLEADFIFRQKMKKQLNLPFLFLGGL